MPMIPFIGVGISWLILVTSSLFGRLDASGDAEQFFATFVQRGEIPCEVEHINDIGGVFEQVAVVLPRF